MADPLKAGTGKKISSISAGPGGGAAGSKARLMGPPKRPSQGGTDYSETHGGDTKP